MHKNCYVEEKSVAKCVRNPLKEVQGKNPQKFYKICSWWSDFKLLGYSKSNFLSTTRWSSLWTTSRSSELKNLRRPSSGKHNSYDRKKHVCCWLKETRKSLTIKRNNAHVFKFKCLP